MLPVPIFMHRAAILLLFILGCAAAAPTSGDATLAEQLRAAGLTVTDGGTIEQPFFTRQARVLRIGDDDLQLYEFATAAEAEQAAAQVAPGGGSIGTVSMHWMAPPHFFRKERLIAIYIGSNARTLAELERILGPQFAGSQGR